MDLELAGKTFVVTGGTRGIGRGISEALLAEGAQVIAVYRRNHEEAERLLEANQESHDQQKLFAVSADLADESTHQGLLENVRDQFGELHGLVNGASTKVEENLTLENVERMTVVTAVAPVVLTYRALDYFSEQGASIVNILSVLKEVYYPEPPLSRAMDYFGAAKGFLETASRLMLDECRSRNVRVNCIAPGPTRGGGQSKSDEIHEKRFKKGQYTMKRRAEIEDVTSTVLFLLSPRSSHLTGQTIYVTGGQEKAPFFHPK